ncbi:zinc-ribbon domain containing protein [Desulfitibacter alkalitolerans]|uniref:zinc-ribbon domain containing protein n=1 Tax=Desulfitibacter alkalitolerans TaxID=264641 RepID=UPI000486D1F4|nr:zinc-ribbon domain containing protein [Desulfitibacter alkalitolerans]
MYTDKNLSCKDCGKEFVFSSSEQEFYAEKGFENEPGRCPECRSAKKAQMKSNRRGGGSGSGGGYGRSQQREMHPATCASCGKSTTVPFRPSGDKPVYCKDCYQPRRNSW